jgi:hypothetical protein
MTKRALASATEANDLSQMGSHRRRRNDRLRVSGLGMYIPCANQGARGNLRDSEAGQEILSNCNEYRCIAVIRTRSAKLTGKVGDLNETLDILAWQLMSKSHKP